MAIADERRRTAEIVRLWEDTDYEVTLRRELAARRKALREYRQNLTTDQARQVVRWIETWPGISDPTALAAGLAGIEPDSDLGYTLADRDYTAEASPFDLAAQFKGATARKGQPGTWWKTALRNTFGAFEALEQEAWRKPWRTFLGAIESAAEDANAEEEGLGEVWRFLREAPTPLGLAGNAITGFGKMLMGDREGGVEVMREGAVGNVMGALEAQPSSALAVGLREGRLGEGAFGPADAILPRGPLIDEPRRAFEEQTFMGLQNPTIGRVVATGLNVNPITRTDPVTTGFIQPGTVSHNLISGSFDFARAIYADPAAVGLRAVGSIARARQLIVPAGVRPTFLAHNADQFLNSRGGREVVRRLAANTDVLDLSRILRTNDVGILRSVADARTADEVYDILYRVMGRELQVRPRGRIDLRGRVSRSAVADTRMGQWWARQTGFMPESVLDIQNPNQGFTTLDNLMKLTRFDRATRAQVLDDWTRLEAGDFDGAYHLLANLMERYRADLLDQGWSEPVARHLTKIFGMGFDETREARRYFTREAAEWHPFTRNVDANGNALPSPHLVGELLNRALPLPDARQMRHALSTVRRKIDRWPDGLKKLVFPDAAEFTRSNPVTAVLGNTWPTAILDPIIQGAWKSLALLRVAIIPRIALEEQGRMAVAGLDSFFRHPLSYVLWATGKRGSGGVFRGADLDNLDDPMRLMDEFQAAMAKGAGGWTNWGPGARSLSGDFVAATKESADYTYGWAVELSQLARDPIAQRIARYGVDDAKEWLWSGDGRAILNRWVESEAPDLAGNRAAAALYVESIYARMHYVTGGNFRRRLFGQNRGQGGRFVPVEESARELTAAEAAARLRDLPSEAARMRYEITEPGMDELWEIFRTGRWRVMDRQGRSRTLTFVGGRPARERRVAQYLEDFIESGPDTVKLPRLIESERTMGAIYRDVVDWLFMSLMTRPTNYLARSPAFRQIYWQRVEDLIPYLDDAGRTQVVAAARANRLPEATVERLRAAGRATLAEGEEYIDLTQLNQLVKGKALMETKDLLYDLTRRRNFFDATRLVFPFGDAWAELLSTWGRQAATNPQLLRRAQQTVEGGRAAGFFMPDPQGSGEELFVVPGAGDLYGSKVLGQDNPDARINFYGFLSGLNIAATGLPGIGPVVTMPLRGAGWLNDPEWLWLRDVAIPYGGQAPNDPVDVVAEFVPPWAEKVLMAMGGGWDELEGIYNGTAIDVLRVLSADGMVDESSPQATIEKAEAGARTIGWIRAVTQFAAPTGVVPRVELRDNKGTWWSLQVLSDEYRQLTEEMGDDDLAATREFIRRYGIDPMNFIAPKTYSTQPRSLTREGAQWERRHAWLFEPTAYPGIAHYFNPAADEGEFDIEVWGARTDEGHRERYTPEQWQELASRMKAELALEAAKQRAAEIGLEGNERTRYLRDVRNWAIEEFDLEGGFYTYEAISGKKEPYSRDAKLAQVERALADPRMADLPPMEGLRLYWDARQEAMRRYAETSDSGSPNGFMTTSGNSKSGEPLRQWLRDYSAWVMANHPDFEPLFEAVFRAEIEEVPEEE